MAFVANLPSGRWHGTQRIKLHAPWLDDDQETNFHASANSAGTLSGLSPHINHGRVSVDGKETLRESAWTEEECTRDYWVVRIAEDTGKNEAAINAQLEHEVMGEGLSIEEGNEIVRQYFADNSDKWWEETLNGFN